MIYLSAEKLSKHVPDKTLFENLTFGIDKGDKVALIADNGTGKSSLLKILVGKDEPDSGEVYIRDTIKTGYLDQEPQLDPAFTIRELLNSGHTEVMNVIREYDQALEEQEKNYNDDTHKRFEEAAAKMELLHAWDYERRLTVLLDKFQVHELDQKIATLSGGQKKRPGRGCAA